MRTTHRSAIDDLRGASRLAASAVKGTTAIVEAMHTVIGSGPAVLGRPFAWPTRVLSAPTYTTIRFVTDLVGKGIDAPLSRLAPLVPRAAPGPEREAVRAALSGVFGDVLAASGNPLAMTTSAFLGDEPFDLSHEPVVPPPWPEPTRALPGKVLILFHGSSMNAAQWLRKGHDHGATLAEALGYAPVYVEYNSGLHISENGRTLAALLERVILGWPTPVTEIAILGFSMGGLVARSACHYAEESGLAWRSHLRKLVTLGTPHHGAPLERAGNWVDLLLGLSRYSAPLVSLGQIRSAGVTDMRFGSVRDEDWRDRDRFAFGPDPRTPLPLPSGVACFAIAATTASDAHARMTSDGLVPVASALGLAAGSASGLSLQFPEDRQAVIFGASHLDLLDRKDVFEHLRAWL